MSMKMVLAILNSDDASTVVHNLMSEGYSATRLASTGGFLRLGNVTILVGVDESKVSDVIAVVKKHSRSRKQLIPTTSEVGINFYPSIPVEVTVGGVIIFVLDVEHFEKA